jgi:uncharacterized membrane protein YecN with MAPEG domain
MITLPITLLAAAAATFLNFWLGGRVAAYRKQFKVSVGDGGQEPLLRRMRAQANFIEHAPFFLILLAALELAGARQGVLVSSAVLFILSRIAHAYGMDGGSLASGRTYGMIGSTIAVLLLCLWAILCAVTVLLGG